MESSESQDPSQSSSQSQGPSLGRLVRLAGRVVPMKVEEWGATACDRISRALHLATRACDRAGKATSPQDARAASAEATGHATEAALAYGELGVEVFQTNAWIERRDQADRESEATAAMAVQARRHLDSIVKQTRESARAATSSEGARPSSERSARASSSSSSCSENGEDDFVPPNQDIGSDRETALVRTCTHLWPRSRGDGDFDWHGRDRRGKELGLLATRAVEAHFESGFLQQCRGTPDVWITVPRSAAAAADGAVAAAAVPGPAPIPALALDRADDADGANGADDASRAGSADGEEGAGGAAAANGGGGGDNSYLANWLRLFEDSEIDTPAAGTIIPGATADTIADE